jgi:hypothetical protein
MASDIDFAVLAPMLEDQLEDARRIADETGYVALPTEDRTNLLEKVEGMREGAEVPFLIYAESDPPRDRDTYAVTWIGSYVGRAEASDGGHPEGDEHLLAEPERGEDDPEPEINGYMHVKDLRPLPASSAIPIASLESHMQRGIYRRNTRPRTPTIVARPRGLDELTE